MAFMFKGPASLTSGSVVTDATSISSADLTATDDIIVGDDLTVADDAAISGDMTVTGTLTTNGPVVANNGITVVSGPLRENILTLTNAGDYSGNIDISNYNILYLANSTLTGNVDVTITWPTVADGQRLFIACINKNASATLRVDFGSTNKIYATLTSGPNMRYLNLLGIGTNALFYYSANLVGTTGTAGVWMSIESNAATLSSS